MTAKEEYMYAVHHSFEIQYSGLQNNQSNHLSKSSEGFIFSDEKLSPVDPDGHGAAVQESNFPKSQATWVLLSIWSAKFSNVGHGILLSFKHLAWATAKWSRQNYLLSNIPRVSILIAYGFPEIFVIICPQLILMSCCKAVTSVWSSGGTLALIRRQRLWTGVCLPKFVLPPA